MEDIATPALLDPDRPRMEGQEDVAGGGGGRAEVLQSSLEEVAAYGRALWHEVDTARRYLLAALPDPSADDDRDRVLSAPRGPDDDAGWDAWTEAYAGLTSVLAGPRGDSGFGRHEATQEALRRRGIRGSTRLAELVDAATTQRQRVAEQSSAWLDPEEEARLAAIDPDDPQLPASERRSRGHDGSSSGDDRTGPGTRRGRPSRSLHVLLVAVGTVLALRGLRPRTVVRVVQPPSA